MSFKTKLAIIFSVIVTVILLLNNTLHYFSTRDLLQAEQEKQMELTAKEIGIAIEHSEFGSNYAENLIAQQLRIASLVAKYALNPDVDKITNEQLAKLSREIGISDITLMKKIGSDIVGVKSSDPKELSMSTKGWGYWYVAFQQLWNNQRVTVGEGQKLVNYWSGPINVSTTKPGDVDKWGYYKDKQINYIINPYVKTDFIANFQKSFGPEAIVQETLKDNKAFLEITGFNLNAFGKPPVFIKAEGVKQVPLQDRPLLFGDYTYKNVEMDRASIRKAAKTGKLVSYDAVVNGKHVLKSFIPVIKSKIPYVIGIVADYHVIQDFLDRQLLSNLINSLAVLLVVYIVSYLLSSYAVRPIQYQASHDFLTGLPNRFKFNEDLQYRVSQNGENGIAVMFIDLDRFKNINDTLGHGTGDRLLKAVAERITEILSNEETFYRLGGDEFTVLLTGHSDDAAVLAKAHQILERLTTPFILEGRHEEFFIAGSIGISIFPCGGTDAEDLVKNADRAMYRAKELGGNRAELYTISMEDAIMKGMALESNLRKAITNQELALFYQPKLDIKTKRVTGMEALVRWQHPDVGMIPPVKFIPLAEETGLILPIGEWVLRTACMQNKSWQEAGFEPMRVAVNLSARQFQQENLIPMIRQVLEETNLKAEYLELEITESISMQNAEQVISKLQELKKIGVQISIDDFGTGYSSLNYLNKFPIDTLKIDKSFVNSIAAHQDTSIVKAIIALAHNLKLKVIAEGVETREQMDFLKEHMCDEIQGFYFSEPLTVAQFEQLLAGHSSVSFQ
ncbi:EAL domain-containing protein [Aneurinibacillus sp. Ricciae_BoGa-3]|uniref:putative bifunctional diguanylate cyclase/phosphodiesterase n=1 Tax=Aneurinibacillus sp. Ricciae_BoGa-3 TaxID=3022697 RepID=UPI002340E6B8|nr:EAL domain-containing protein [Aneurinibacillus sp. Ricciae_BoGa-3]WCK53170.1 EAL domain-containing protein [Aneurinibacillus sp. Ricciae_BoGa-3]